MNKENKIVCPVIEYKKRRDVIKRSNAAIEKLNDNSENNQKVLELVKNWERPTSKKGMI